MNIFSALFGIFRQGGLVLTLREGRPLGRFALSAILLSIFSGVLYGFAMGIGLGPETAVKDAIKVGLVVTLSLLFAIPIFWLAYRLLGREETASQVAAVPLTFVATSASILAVTSPLVFLLSLLIGFSPEGIYIHIVIVDLALLVGLYMAGTLIYHSFTVERNKLIVPNVVSFVMLGVILVVLIQFFSPFLTLSSTFSMGTDLFKDRMGIGVLEKAQNALDATAVAERLTYRYQTTNQNGDLEQDYTVTRVGGNYLIEVHLHAVPDERLQTDQRIWIFDNEIYTDFADGQIAKTDEATLSSILDPVLPPLAFQMPENFASATWRGLESDGLFTATGVNPTLRELVVTLDPDTLRLLSMELGSTERGLQARTTVKDIRSATLDRTDLENNLNRALVLSQVDRSDASLQEFVQEETFFVVRYPRTWQAGRWDADNREITFINNCPATEECPQFVARIFDLNDETNAQQYAQVLADSLSLQPDYRMVTAATRTINANTVGEVSYLFDRVVDGEVETTQHLELIFVGAESRYHLNFSAPQDRFEPYSALFEAIATGFTFLQ